MEIHKFPMVNVCLVTAMTTGDLMTKVTVTQILESASSVSLILKETIVNIAKQDIMVMLLEEYVNNAHVTYWEQIQKILIVTELLVSVIVCLMWLESFVIGN